MTARWRPAAPGAPAGGSGVAASPGLAADVNDRVVASDGSGSAGTTTGTDAAAPAGLAAPSYTREGLLAAVQALASRPGLDPGASTI